MDWMARAFSAQSFSQEADEAEAQGQAIASMRCRDGVDVRRVFGLLSVIRLGSMDVMDTGNMSIPRSATA